MEKMQFKSLIYKALIRTLIQIVVIFIILHTAFYYFSIKIDKNHIYAVFSLESELLVLLITFLGIVIVNSFLLFRFIHVEIKHLLDNCNNYLQIDSDRHKCFYISEISEINGSFKKYREKLYSKYSKEIELRNQLMFLTSISSHDIKSRLTVTQGNIDMLYESILNEEQRNYLKDISSALIDSSYFINNLIQYLNILCLQRYDMSEYPIRQLFNDIQQDILVFSGTNISEHNNIPYDTSKTVRIYISETLRAVNIAVRCFQKYTNNSEIDIRSEISLERDSCIFTIKSMGEPFKPQILIQNKRSSSMECICENTADIRFIAQIMYVKKVFEMDGGSVEITNINKHPVIKLFLPLL